MQSLYEKFEYKEIDGERVFGAANGGIWWQITVRQIGAGHVLLAIISDNCIMDRG